MQACEALSEGHYAFHLPNRTDAAECVAGCFDASDCGEMRAHACDDSFASVDLRSCIRTCLSFTCEEGGEIDLAYICDGERDCLGGEDEVDCNNNVICSTGDIVPDVYVCDGDPDCPGGEDEANCPGPVTFACNDGTQIPSRYRCNGEPDCADGEDEAGCAEFLCPSF